MEIKIDIMEIEIDYEKESYKSNDLIILDDHQEKDKLNYKLLTVNFENITFNKLIFTISDNFKIKKQFRLFNFYNREIIDSSDLKFLETEENKMVVIVAGDYSQFIVDNKIYKCFKTISKLGEGGFGKVYLVEQKFTKVKYALKHLKFLASKYIFIFRARHEVF